MLPLPTVIVVHIIYGGHGYTILHFIFFDFLYFVNVYMYATQERYIPAAGGVYQPYDVPVVLLRIVCM